MVDLLSGLISNLPVIELCVGIPWSREALGSPKAGILPLGDTLGSDAEPHLPFDNNWWRTQVMTQS